MSFFSILSLLPWLSYSFSSSNPLHPPIPYCPFVLSHSLPYWLHPSSLSLTSSQASLALIDPLVRAYCTAMNCIVTRRQEQEGVGMEIRGQPQQTYHCKGIIEKVWCRSCVSVCFEMLPTKQDKRVTLLFSVLTGWAEMLSGALLYGNI